MGPTHSVHYHHEGKTYRYRRRPYHAGHRHHTYYREYPGAPWWGYHYIYNPIEGKDMKVFVKRQGESNIGKVYDENGKYMTKILVKSDEEVTKTEAPKTFENTAELFDDKGNFITEMFVEGDGLDDDDEDTWDTYKVTIHEPSS